MNKLYDNFKSSPNLGEDFNLEEAEELNIQGKCPRFLENQDVQVIEGSNTCGYFIPGKYYIVLEVDLNNCYLLLRDSNDEIYWESMNHFNAPF